MTNTHTAAIDYFNARAEEVAAQYNAMDRRRVHADLLALLPEDKTLQVLDVGAGSGADADMFAQMGHFVVAAEPASALRDIAMKCFDNMNIVWNDDVLPELAETSGNAMHFDIVMASCVLQYLDENSRDKSLEKIVSLVNVGGLIEVQCPVSPTRTHQFELKPDEIKTFVTEYNKTNESGQELEMVIEKTVPDYSGRKALDGSASAYNLWIIKRLR